MADLLAAWTTTSESTDTTLTADIAVTIEADVLTGLRDGFAASADGSWAVPASWILDEALTGEAFWNRILIDPISSDILAHQYVGRFAPDLLGKAIYPSAVGRAEPAGRVAASSASRGMSARNERVPSTTGATTADNIWALCRRHHALKGHRVLQWVLPSGQAVAAGTTEHRIRPAEASSVEHQLARLVIEGPTE